MAVEVLKIASRITGGKLKDRIYRVGVELEGGWKKLPAGVTLTHDGSIQGLVLEPELGTAGQQVAPPRRVDRWGNPIQAAPSIRRTRADGLNVGELVSEPLEPKAVAKYLRTYYPSHVNATCGLHVHMSFTNALHYQMLMVPEYQATMAHYLLEWAKEEEFEKKHSIWARLTGKNEYCKLEFFADDQVTQTRKNFDHHRRGNRYTGINYPHGMHQTIECRFLPMMESAEQAVRAVERVLTITNACLSVMGKKEHGKRIPEITDDIYSAHTTLRI